MLTNRQLEMLNTFIIESGDFLTSDSLSEILNVSVRTVKNDLAVLREFVDDFEKVELISVRSRGTHLTFEDNESKEAFIDFINENYDFMKSGDDSKVTNKISRYLLETKNYLSLTNLSHLVYVSESSLIQEINKIERLIENFDLKIENKRGHGYRIVGTERNKRFFLVSLGNYGLGLESLEYYTVSIIEDVLTETLLAYEYPISDTIFQNLIVHLYASINRMKEGFILDEDFKSFQDNQIEVEIADILLKKLKTKIQFNYNEAEVINLAIYLKGKSDYDKSDYISKDVNDFILLMLGKIKHTFDINLTQEIDLRISLALHFMPMLTRIQFNLQLKNKLLSEIKKTFPIAFDIGVYASYLINEKYDTKLEEGEIAYLAIYFNKYIESLDQSQNKQDMLLITSMKRSETILFRQKILKWFGTEIENIISINEHQVNEVDFESYDLVFTTEKKYVDPYGAIYIAMYPTERDYPKIKLAVDGFKDKHSILSMFSEERFVVADFGDKNEVLDAISSMSSVGNVNQDELKKSVLLREHLGSTYFGNGIAFPHPINPISFETFASVIIPSSPLTWDEDDNIVNIVILVVIEKNNFKAFQLWNYLSTLVENRDYISKILRTKSYKDFIEIISESIDLTLGG